ncbi:MAG: glycosyltransferase N-terminal domain-containing protein, partial [Acidobacteriota bacterium]
MTLLRSAGWLGYQLAMGAGLAASAPILALGGRGVRHYLPTLRGRLTLATPPALAERPLWIHAVSVGEVAVAATFVRALPASLPLLVTTVTPTGQARARALFADRDATRMAYLPFDLGPPTRRFLDRHRPSALLLVEGDYWPLQLAEAKRRSLPIGVLNARSSDRAFARQRRLGAVNRLFYGPIDRFGTQTEADRERLVALGVAPERVRVTGNLKFDAAAPIPQEALAAALLTLADGRPILVAGSTMENEEPHVLDALARLDRPAMLLLAPRHPERWDGVARAVEARGLSLLRRSKLDLGARPADRSSANPPKVVLLDSLGELASTYSLARAAFVGGTLVPTGGHNPLEPAQVGAPIVVGPSMDNFRDIATQFAADGAWRRVDDADGLAAAWRTFVDDRVAAETL